MAMAAAIMKIIGGAAQAGGAISEGRAQAHRSNYIASLLDDDARITRLEAAQEIVRYRRAASRLRGTTKATIGASGLAAQGSSNDVLFDSFREEAIEVQNIKYQAERKATKFEHQARLERSAGRSARHAGNRAAASSILDTASDVVGGGGFGGGS